MATEPITTRMALVVLRAALAAIFISHGLDKAISPRGDWGASWATDLLQRKASLPPEFRDRLEALQPQDWLDEAEQAAKLSEEKVAALAVRRRSLTETSVQRAYAAKPPDMPAISPYLQCAVAWGELLGGAALLIGLFTRLAAVGLVAIQLGAIYFVTGVLGLTGVGQVGFEYNLALVAMGLAILLQGPGGWSLDHLFWGRQPRE